MAPSRNQEPCSLGQLLIYFLRLGAVGFGGPIALAGRMDRDLVEEKGWVSRQDYVEGLAFSQLSPGPLAAQLAMYIGWVRAGRLGAALVAFAFISPSFLMAIGVASLYMRFERLPWIQDLFYGVGAAVIAIIRQSAYRLSRKTIGSDRFLWALFGVVALTTVLTGSEIVWFFFLLPKGRSIRVWQRTRYRSISLWRGCEPVPLVDGRQFVDAIAVAMITPGPVVITAAFIGFLVAGFVGGAVAAAAVFAPPFLIVVKWRRTTDAWLGIHR